MLPAFPTDLKPEHPRYVIRASRRTALVVCGALALTAGSFGLAAGATPAPAPPPFLQTLIAAGKVKLLRSFDTGKPGLTGHVVQQGDKSQVVFGEDGYLFVGQLFSPQGRDLVARYSDQYLPKPDVTATVKLLEDAGHLIVQGPANAPRLYVFADPNCIFCHRFYRMAEPLVKAGKLQLRWVMVGFLRPTSMAKSVAILGAADPLRALQVNETKFNIGAEEGGIAPAQHAVPALQALIKAHFSSMQAVGGSGTPTLLYRIGASKWAARVGVPPASWLGAYAGGKTLATAERERR